MRIVRLARRLPPLPGGMETHVRELTVGQLRQGAAIELLLCEGEPPDTPGLSAHRIAQRIRGLPSWWSIEQRFAWNAAQYHLPTPGMVDVVHAHGDYPSGWAAIRLARRLRCPAVLTVHGGLSEAFAHRLASRLIFPQLDHVIAVSPDVARQLRGHGVRPSRLSVISSGIHRSRYGSLSSAERSALRNQLGIPPEAVCLITVGRLHPVKGLEHLIAAVPVLRSQGCRFCVLVVGDGSQAASLRQLAAPFPEVRFLGARDAETVARLLQLADLFVCPSVVLNGQREGTPTSLLEAMAAGLPVVATRTGGIPFLVEEGVNGLLGAPGSATELARAIAILLADAPRRTRMGRVNRQAVQDRDWADVAKAVFKAYGVARASHAQRRA